MTIVDEKEYVGIVPVDFFRKKIGREICLTELLLLEFIIDTYSFEEEITNLLIEQVLKLNNNRLTRGFTLKVADKWSESNFSNLTEAINYANNEFNEFLLLQQGRDNYGEIRELTSKEKEVVNRIFYKNDLEQEILDVVIRYCMKINDGYIISWFINRLIEFLKQNQPKNQEEAKELIQEFHHQYVINFGVVGRKA